ncbi:MAG: C-3',4' desaturase CrtD, partial [Microcystaceae cyanobacterium]
MNSNVIIIGAGIGGLTAAALLAEKGYQVTVYEQAIAVGGCASTFKRRGFTFDVGATQVAGLEPGGIHHRIFSQLGLDVPTASFCDPACAVFLPGEKKPISMWHDPQKWQQERQFQFPGSEPFWQLFEKLFQASWQFQARDPVLPPRNFWDLQQLILALRLDTLITVPFTLMTVGDALRLYGLAQDYRLKTFLDLQLKLYSQVNADETALLYAATALAVSQAPQGLYHLEGSMQVLSDRLVEGVEKFGGLVKLKHSVEKIETINGKAVRVQIKNLKTGEVFSQEADQIIGNVTVQNLITLLDKTPVLYRQRVENLPEPSGAFVIYLGVKDTAIPENCPPHLQFFYDDQGPMSENNSLFVSVSKADDGRAPTGQRTLIASSFVDVKPWWSGSEADYQKRKQDYTETAIANLSNYFNLTPETILYQEAATPRTFATFTARQKGFVGGISQRISTFGPFGLATRTPIKNLWLVGDSTHPGEGTAGVSYSAL